MNPSFESLLLDWPLSVIRDVDIATVMTGSVSRRHAAVNRALKRGSLVQLRRGLYLIGKPFRKPTGNHFQIAHTIYGPSYVSLESALSYHQWIPEAVYTTTCATAKRAREFETPLGLFQYTHVPEKLFYLGVRRVGDTDKAYFIAEPWKALADYYYVYKKDWTCLEDIYADLRIEIEDMVEGDLTILRSLSENYMSARVKSFLKKIMRSLERGN